VAWTKRGGDSGSLAAGASWRRRACLPAPWRRGARKALLGGPAYGYLLDGGRSREERAGGGGRSRPTQHTEGCLLVALPGERSREEVLAGGRWWRALHGGREGGRAQHEERAREVERAGGRHQ